MMHDDDKISDEGSDDCGYSGGDEGAGIGFATMHGRDYPSIRQFYGVS